MASRWAWLDEARPVGGEGRDADGRPTVSALEDWARRSVEAWLSGVPAIREALLAAGAALQLAVRVEDPRQIGPAPAVDLHATPVEVLPTSLVVALRFRAADGAGQAVDGRVIARLVSGAPAVALAIDRPVRDALIALAHASPHWG